MKQEKNLFDNKQLLFDSFISQQFLTTSYNYMLNHISTPKIQDELVNLLSEEHQICFEIQEELLKRGWLQQEKADSQQVQQVKRRFTNQEK